MKTHATKGSDEAKEQTQTMSDMTDTVRKNWEQSLRTGLKFQEEAGRWWSSVFNPATCAEQWQERFNSVTSTASSVLPLAQKPAALLIDLAEKNNRVSAELTKKAMDAAQTTTIAESQSKWAEFWTSSLNAAQANTEALSEISSETMDSWARFIRKNTDGAESKAA